MLTWMTVTLGILRPSRETPIYAMGDRGPGSAGIFTADPFLAKRGSICLLLSGKPLLVYHLFTQRGREQIGPDIQGAAN